MGNIPCCAPTGDGKDHLFILIVVCAAHIICDYNPLVLFVVGTVCNEMMQLKEYESTIYLSYLESHYLLLSSLNFKELTEIRKGDI